MKKFEIVQSTKLYSRFIVEAETEEEARRKFEYEGGEYDGEEDYNTQDDYEIESIEEVEV